MEILPNDLTLHIPPSCFPLSTDSMLLAHFTRLPRSARVLDLGSGCGTLGLLLCAGNGTCHVTGVERDETAHQAALGNIARNQLDARMESVCAPWQSVSVLFSPGRFTTVVSNPPYFTGGPASRAHPAARQGEDGSLEELFRAAAWGLKFGGDFYLVHRPEYLAALITQGAGHGLEPKDLTLVHHAPGGDPSLLLLRLRKGGKPGLKLRSWYLHTSDGEPTELYRQIYHF